VSTGAGAGAGAGAGGAEGAEALAQFTEWVGSEEWTLEHDEALVRLVNDQCDVAGIDPSQLRLQPAPASSSFPALLKVRARALWRGVAR
jgi:hypothetical protein